MAWHTGLAAKLKDRDIKVKVVKGWKSRGRFPFNPIGTMFHHTASNKKSGNAPSLGLVTHGSSRTAPGPLCNVLVARDGTIIFVAAGKANHAGYGGAWGRVPKDSGNTYLVGKEYENNGIGENWNPEQLRAGEIFDELFLEHIGAKTPNRRCPGHKEYAPKRKIDPGGINMKGHRNRVKALMKGPKPAPKPAPKPKPPAKKFKSIKAGDQGEKVFTVQKRLTRHGFKVRVDGDFGSKTRAAVRRFQKAKHLKVSGVVGKATWDALAKGGK